MPKQRRNKYNFSIRASFGLALFLSSLFTNSVCAQQDSIPFTLNEYLGYVKRFHPIVRQAQLILNQGQAELLKARGGFDPKIEVDYSQKKFKGLEYYDILNGTFKIPTWYGIELKAAFEQNEGDFLNPERNVPDEGLYAAGVSVSLLRNSWINERMATLRRARFFLEQSQADRDLAVNQILYEATEAYLDWTQFYNEAQIYAEFLDNARIRFEGIRTSVLAGDKAAIDTVEAKIAYQNRQLQLEKARLKTVKSVLELSNYLWIDNVPVELQPDVVPESRISIDLTQALGLPLQPQDSLALQNHPKLRSLFFKREALRIDRRFKANQLLPQLDVQYNFITAKPEEFNSVNTAEYKGGLQFSFPLFLRKERGALRLARFKLQDIEFEYSATNLRIRNKIQASFQEITSLQTQQVLIDEITDNYVTLLRGEERKFTLGESSVFLINSRESKLIDARLKQNELIIDFYEAQAKLFNILAIIPEDLRVQP